MRLLSTQELLAKWERDRLGAWPCHAYPYADFDTGLLYACWWSWWTVLAPKLDYASWTPLCLTLERLSWSAGQDPLPDGFSPQVRALLSAYA